MSDSFPGNIEPSAAQKRRRVTAKALNLQRTQASPLSASSNVYIREGVQLTASYFIQNAPPCVTEHCQMPPERRETVIELGTRGSGLSTVDRSILKLLAREKKLDELPTLGGIAGIATLLETDLQRGISCDSEDISRRTLAFGPNSYVVPLKKTFLRFLWEAFTDLILVMLLFCAALLLGFGIKVHGLREGWYDGGSIFVALFLVIAVTAIRDWRQHRQFDKLSKVSNNIRVEVVRNGRREQISISEIVVGDVVCLKIGDQVPADGLFIDGYSLQVDESSITGESDLIQIDGNANPFMFSGAKVVDGYAKMLVTCVGMNTIWGEMMSAIRLDSYEQTPLEARLNRLASSIGKVSLTIAFLVLVVLLVRYLTGNTEDENGNKEFNGRKTKADEVINAVVRIVAAAVTIIVVAVPEGLPLAVTLTLAYSMKRMVADRALIRNLSACETIGSATAVCTDKTGVLTLNQMKVTKFWQGKEAMEGRHYTLIPRKIVELLHQGAGLNTTGSVYKSGIELEYSGSPTEKAILSWAVLDLQMDVEEVKRGCNIIHVETFNSQKKRSGILVKKVDEDNMFHVHWKGAAELILSMCSHYYDSEGNREALYEHERVEFVQIIENMAASSLRCIAFAHKQVLGESQPQNEIQESGLTLLGLVGLKDPCRPGVKEAIQSCQRAGVNVRMITGDNVSTAKAIAIDCGILDPDPKGNYGESVVEGVQFRNYTEVERMEKVENIRVMARSSPLDKLLMVQCLRIMGHVVAVTGDGVNDAPALHEADIGLCMGMQGTEVAKESSDIVILDDNFASVATVLSWGRCVYNNIQKFIQFELTVNAAALAINIVAAVAVGKVPLTPLQLLWVNLIMDTLGALALATGKPTGELMEKPPVGRSEALVSNVMWRNIIGLALYQTGVILALLLEGDEVFIFTTFIVMQVFNLLNARELEEKNVFKGILKSKVFVGIVGIIIVVQVIMVEFLNKFVGTQRLGWKEWGISIGFAAVSWAVGALIKFLPVPNTCSITYPMVCGGN